MSLRWYKIASYKELFSAYFVKKNYIIVINKMVVIRLNFVINHCDKLVIGKDYCGDLLNKDLPTASGLSFLLHSLHEPTYNFGISNPA
ncbi:hypothetical protein B0I10_11790 [Flavobacterium lacus]|uniref:Uncharacterized protein n=1 Tax=Flavobacterium lacus TaxID=1353778 RepID=A0A328WK21_9FLAO|nr:hypothetical protein B0I10_11790 [Flavobacterium lacus]